MKSNPVRYNKLSNQNKEGCDELIAIFFAQAKAQFGDAVKAFWFYDGDYCPGCLAQATGAIKFKGKDVLALNAFIYRPRGVLIGYFLCETCANFIFKEAQEHPFRQTPLHAEIERNLIAAYHRHLAALDA